MGKGMEDLPQHLRAEIWKRVCYPQGGLFAKHSVTDRMMLLRLCRSSHDWIKQEILRKVRERRRREKGQEQAERGTLQRKTSLHVLSEDRSDDESASVSVRRMSINFTSQVRRRSIMQERGIMEGARNPLLFGNQPVSRPSNDDWTIVEVEELGDVDLLRWFLRLEDMRDSLEKAWNWAIQESKLLLLEELMMMEEVDPSWNDTEALTWASSAGFSDVAVKLLQDRRVYPSVRDNLPLINACRSGSDEIVSALLSHHDLNTWEEEHFAKALKIAAVNGYFKVVALLVDFHPPPSLMPEHLRDPDSLKDRFQRKQLVIDPALERDYPLRKAAKLGHSLLVDFLCSLTPGQVNPGVDDQYPIRIACKEGHTDTVAALLKSPQVNPGIRDNICFRMACQFGYLEIAQLLAAHPQVRVDAANNDALMRACEEGHVLVVKWLLTLSSRGVDPGALRSEALVRACVGGHLRVVSLLLADNRTDPAAQGQEIFRLTVEYGRANTWLQIITAVMAHPRSPAMPRASDVKREGRVERYQMLLDMEEKVRKVGQVRRAVDDLTSGVINNIPEPKPPVKSQYIVTNSKPRIRRRVEKKKHLTVTTKSSGRSRRSRKRDGTSVLPLTVEDDSSDAFGSDEEETPIDDKFVSRIVHTSLYDSGLSLPKEYELDMSTVEGSLAMIHGMTNSSDEEDADGASLISQTTITDASDEEPMYSPPSAKHWRQSKGTNASNTAVDDVTCDSLSVTETDYNSDSSTKRYRSRMHFTLNDLVPLTEGVESIDELRKKPVQEASESESEATSEIIPEKTADEIAEDLDSQWFSVCYNHRSRYVPWGNSGHEGDSDSDIDKYS